MFVVVFSFLVLDLSASVVVVVVPDLSLSDLGVVFSSAATLPVEFELSVLRTLPPQDVKHSAAISSIDTVIAMCIFFIFLIAKKSPVYIHSSDKIIAPPKCQTHRTKL